MRRGKFEIRENASGQYYFVLKAGNGEVIATSESYTTKAAARKGIRSVRFNAPFAKEDVVVRHHLAEKIRERLKEQNESS